MVLPGLSGGALAAVLPGNRARNRVPSRSWKWMAATVDVVRCWFDVALNVTSASRIDGSAPRGRTNLTRFTFPTSTPATRTSEGDVNPDASVNMAWYVWLDVKFRSRMLL